MSLALAGEVISGRLFEGLHLTAASFRLVLLNNVVDVFRQLLELPEPEPGGFLPDVPVLVSVVQGSHDPACGSLQLP